MRFTVHLSKPRNADDEALLALLAAAPPAFRAQFEIQNNSMPQTPVLEDTNNGSRTQAGPRAIEALRNLLSRTPGPSAAEQAARRDALLRPYLRPRVQEADGTGAGAVAAAPARRMHADPAAAAPAPIGGPIGGTTMLHMRPMGGLQSPGSTFHSGGMHGGGGTLLENTFILNPARDGLTSTNMPKDVTKEQLERMQLATADALMAGFGAIGVTGGPTTRELLPVGYIDKGRVDGLTPEELLATRAAQEERMASNISARPRVPSGPMQERELDPRGLLSTEL